MVRDDIDSSIGEPGELLHSDSLTGRVLGDFVVHEEIGRGGYATVYRAEQQTLSREVVIKALRSRGDEAHIKWFLDEARLASQLDHPYAAHIYAFGVEPDGLLWLAMELVRGTVLKDLLAKQGPIPLSRFVPLLEKICEVVYTAHEHRIIHRDIKPSNIMVLSRAGRLLPKLLDFGIAQLVEDKNAQAAPLVLSERADSPLRRALGSLHGDDVTVAFGPEDNIVTRTMGEDALPAKVGASLGSPPYMAPEQWRDSSKADARADQYSLGILTYEALTGKRPFRARTLTALAMAHATRPLPPLGPEFPQALGEVLARATAKEKGDRYRDVLEMVQAVRSAAELEIEPESMPQLDIALCEIVLAKAPQPLADSVALLEAARSPKRALAAAIQVIRVTVRLVALLAMAALTRVGLGEGARAREGRAALLRLGQDEFSTSDWLELARALVHPFAATPDAHPLPELVLLFYGLDGGSLGQTALHEIAVVAQRYSPATRSTISDEEALDALRDALVRIGRALPVTSVLYDYPWVVKRSEYAESWMGGRRSRRAMAKLRRTGDIRDGEVVLTANDGEPLLLLSPLVRLLAPAPGALEEMFLFDGPGRYGAKMVSYPIGFAHHDREFWRWYRENVAPIQEAFHGEGSEKSAADSERGPYLGLSAFSPADAGNYFGREKEVENCVNRLRVAPMLVVVGPSGAGKSSLVQAGIIPALDPDWRAIIARPGPNPIDQLTRALRRADILVDDMRSRLERDAGALGHAVRRSALASGQTLVIVVDQFEELLTLCLDPGEQKLYASAVSAMASDGEQPVRLVITIRDDFLLRAQALPALRDRLSHSLQLLATPPPDELERILIEPARRLGYKFEDAELPAEMVAAVAEEPGALALLSFTASKLWELRDRRFRQLTRRSYEALGGVGGALAQHAEKTRSKMSPQRQALVREAFRQLVTADGTRAVLTRDELSQMLGQSQDSDAVLEDLIRARLLVSFEGESGQYRVEIVHEALLTSWPRLVRWQREDAENARLRDQLRAAARQWDQRGRPAGLLWRGDALLEYRVWRARYPGSLTETEEEFSQASLGEEARIQRRKRALVVSVFVALSAVVIVVLYLYRQADDLRVRAEDNETRAQASAAVAHERMLELYIEQGRQALLAGDAIRAFAYLTEARQEGADGPALRFMVARAARALDDQLLVLAGHEGQLVDARFSPDGSLIATAGGDKTARIWDADTGALLHTLGGYENTVWTVRFSPDGARLATAAWDGSVKVWQVATGDLVWSATHDGQVFAAEFSPGGRRIATASLDKTARIWDAESGRIERTLSGHSGGLTSLAFSPDGKTVITGSSDRSARSWDVATGQLLATAGEHRGFVLAVAVSPDGAQVATSSRGNDARLSPIRGGQAIELVAHDQPVNRVAFSPDGKWVITASDDSTAKVWDAETGRLLRTLEGHTGGVVSAGFSRDGDRIITASRDGTARVWDSDNGLLMWTYLGHTDGIWSAQFHPEGTKLVTAALDGTARVWNGEATQHELALPAHDSEVFTAAFSPDGQFIAAAQASGIVRVWDRAGKPVAALETGHDFPRVAWSPDGQRLLTLARTSAAIWDWRSSAVVLQLEGHTARIYAGAYARDGSRIVTASKDKSARIWDSRTGKLLFTLRGHDAGVNHADFDPSGRRVVTASADGSARMWDATTGDYISTLIQKEVALNSLRFSVDGALIITAAEDKTAAVWSAGGKLLTLLEGHASDVTSAVLGRDNHLAATASMDGTVKIWDATSGSLLWSIDQNIPKVWSVDVGPDGRSLLAPAGKTAKVWDIAGDVRESAELTAFAACRVSYEISRGQLKRIKLDYQRCNRR